MADQDRGGQRGATVLGKQSRSVCGDELGQLGRELLDTAVEAAQVRDLLARDPDPGAGRQFAQLPVDAVEHPGLVQRSTLERALQLGVQLEQVPPQPVHRAGALGDEIVSVIEQQPDLHRPLVQVRDRESLDTVLHDSSGDRQRVDLIRLAWLALTLARGAHSVRRHPDDPLARCQQRLLKPARTRAAVLDRPHPLLIELSRPPHRSQVPRLVSLDLAAAAHLPRSLIDRRQRVRPLVRVRPDHDHAYRPFVWLTPNEADLRRTTVTRGEATLLSSHAGGPRTAAGDTSFAGQAKRSTQKLRVSPPPARGPTGRVGGHRPDPETITVTEVSVAAHLDPARVWCFVGAEATVMIMSSRRHLDLAGRVMIAARTRPGGRLHARAVIGCVRARIER